MSPPIGLLSFAAPLLAGGHSSQAGDLSSITIGDSAVEVIGVFPVPEDIDVLPDDQGLCLAPFEVRIIDPESLAVSVL